MSGFEVAGIVLGAFPLAITALERYREIATRLNWFFEIRAQYNMCFDDLEFHQFQFRDNIRRVLFPLVADEGKIEALLGDPGGPDWKENGIEEHLQEKLKDAYALYIRYLSEMKRIMSELNREFALDSRVIQDSIHCKQNSTTKQRLLNAFGKDGRDFQLFKIRFIKAESVRKQLLSEFGSYNEKIGKLHSFNNEHVSLLQQTQSLAKESPIDPELCTFWLQALILMRALVSAWDCRCQATHSAELRLQSRTAHEANFYVIFTTTDSSHWDVCETIISKVNDMASGRLQEEVTLPVAAPIIKEPDHRHTLPQRPAIKSTVALDCPQRAKKPKSVRLTCDEASTQLSSTPQISALCDALGNAGGTCCGYLKEDQWKFYIYPLSRQITNTPPSFITLDSIIHGDGLPQPSRLQRYALALTIASSFLQLIESSWLPHPFRKSDVLFRSSPDNPGHFLIDQPHVRHSFNIPRKGKSPAKSLSLESIADSLDQLGIILLELGFGEALEQQDCRKKWPKGRNEEEMATYDLIAARSWQRQIFDEAGFDYAEAVAWCLGGNRSTSQTRWRQEMLQKVVRPLQQSGDYLGNPRR